MQCERVLEHFTTCREEGTETVYYPVLGGIEICYCALHAEEARKDIKKPNGSYGS